MARPVIGVIGNSFEINGRYSVYGAGAYNVRAVAKLTGAVPMIVPTDPDSLALNDLMETCDGFVFTGARANVHPDEYGHTATAAYGDFDRGRDQITLPLIRACVERGQPILSICRGFQELNVAMGGTLHPEIRELPGRFNHRMPPEGTEAEIFELRQRVTFTEGGVFHRLMGAPEVMTNTLHGQGIETPGERIVVDGRADDTTPEAIYVDGAPGFTLGVQWHPEYKADEDPVSSKLFRAFGAAVQDFASDVQAKTA